MRHFHSYGPVDCTQHFCVPRAELVEKCVDTIVDDPVKGGHFFTIWAPRQAGKTWIMRQVVKKIEEKYLNRFLVKTLSMQAVVMDDDDPEHAFLKKVPLIFERGFGLQRLPVPEDWEHFERLFAKQQLFDRPVLLFIDEFDNLPAHIIDRLVSLFRDIYLRREEYLLHGLALIGVRAVLGVESRRGSPFNIQRSLHVPNLTLEEVKDMYHQYQEESGQKIQSEVIETVYSVTHGQAGLVSWFGELLTETYNPGPKQAIDMNTWKLVWLQARTVEVNNTLTNLIVKARAPEYREFLASLFSHAEIPFSFHTPLHNYLYLHGIIKPQTITEPTGELNNVCRFSSPFIQHCLYDALSEELLRDTSTVLALQALDELNDVFEGSSLNLGALLTRYKEYLGRLKAKGLNPWKEQPRRKEDLHLTEAVGHFHLYAWLKDAVGDRCVVSPEFPTGNGKVDIHMKCAEKRGIIEVKSFRSMSAFKRDKLQAAGYAKELQFDAVTIAVFLPLDDQSVLDTLSVTEEIDGIRVTVVAIGWV
ncbi:MAG: hypothetical protein GY801_37055 [bacterium]|nr:hypothetical protein [bacterium]